MKHISCTEFAKFYIIVENVKYLRLRARAVYSSGFLFVQKHQQFFFRIKCSKQCYINRLEMKQK